MSGYFAAAADSIGAGMTLKNSVSQLRRFAMLTLVSPFAVACGGGDGPTDSEPVLVTLSVSPATLNVGLGQSKIATVSFARQGKGNSPVSLGLAFQPPGVTVTFEPSVVTAPTASITLTVAVAPDAQTARFDIPIIATNADIVGGQPAILVLTTFAPQVNVTRAGPGTGTVTSSPPGINCGSACSSFFNATPLTLTAAPASGSTFEGFSGACVATTTTCTFELLRMRRRQAVSGKTSEAS